MPNQLQQQGRETPLFSRTPGLNIVLPSELLDTAPDKSPLSLAYNVDLTDNGGVERRYGYQLLQNLVDPHSLWADGNFCFVVSQTSLYQVQKDFTAVAIRDNLIAGLPTYFAKIGQRVYYENTEDCGLVETGIDLPWNLFIPNDAPPEAVYSFPVLGKYLTAYNGRLYCAVDSYLYFTEYMNPHATRMGRNVAQMPAPIAFIVASEDVLWVGTDEGIVALTGGGIQEFKFTAICNYPAMRGTVARVPTGRYKPGTWWFCNTPNGICVLGPNGAFENLTKDAVALPGESGCAAVFPSGKYVVTFD